MQLISVDKNVFTESFFMKDLHSHAHYEIYLLQKGTRTLFLSNDLLHLEAPSLIIIPPHLLHMTGGGPFERINIDVSPLYLEDFEKEILSSRALMLYKLDGEKREEVINLFERILSIDKKSQRGEYFTKSLFKYFIYLLEKLKGERVLSSNSLKEKSSKLPLLVLRTINYLTENYYSQHTLSSLSKEFYCSKGALIYNFNKYLNCTPIDFLLNVRLTEAKKMLANTNMSIAEISDKCGFSSANYFGVIFRAKEGVSPKNYRKLLVKY